MKKQDIFLLIFSLTFLFSILSLFITNSGEIQPTGKIASDTEIDNLIKSKKEIQIQKNPINLNLNESESSCILFENRISMENISLKYSEELEKVFLEIKKPEKISTNKTQICFTTERVYEKECFIGFFCKQSCETELKQFAGDITLNSFTEENQQSLKLPLHIKIACNPHGRDYTPLFLFLATVSLLIVAYIMDKKSKINQIEEDEEKLHELEEKIKKEKKEANRLRNKAKRKSEKKKK